MRNASSAILGVGLFDDDEFWSSVGGAPEVVSGGEDSVKDDESEHTQLAAVFKLGGHVSRVVVIR